MPSQHRDSAATRRGSPVNFIFYLDFFRPPAVSSPEKKAAGSKRRMHMISGGGVEMANRSFGFTVRALLLLFALHAVCGFARAADADVVIVKYGSVSVKSPLANARIYIDDINRGGAENVVDNVLEGEHAISCRTDSRAVSGRFTIKKDETLRLEALFDENKLVQIVEHEKPMKVVEVEKKPKPEPPAPAPKPEKPKKAPQEVKKEPKKEEKNPVEERRELHLNVIKAYFDGVGTAETRIKHKINPKVIDKFAEKTSRTGTYFRTKKGISLCEAGPCEQQWSSSFQYVDDTGTVSVFSLTWKQAVFSGITPEGTSSRELIYCLGGECRTLEDSSETDKPQTAVAGRYVVVWSRSSLVIRRSDIMKEITDSGGVAEAY
jgi:hypothetical protein